MKRKKYLACCLAMSMMLVSASPMAVSAEAQEDFFYSEEQGVEDAEVMDAEVVEGDFTSEETEKLDGFSAQADVDPADENNESTNDGWTQSERDSRLYYKYDSETKTLEIKASEPVALPDNEQSGRNSEWYNAETANATTVIIGDNITKIGEQDFDNSTDAYPNLQNVVLSSSVKEISWAAFYKTATLQSINLESVESIGNASFGKSGIEKANFEQSSVIIGENAFANCPNLTEVKIKGIANIGDLAFYSCTKLNTFSCDSNVTKVGTQAFNRCTKLSSYSSLATVEIGELAFSRCKALKEFDFSGTESMGDYAFSNTAIEKANFVVLKEIGSMALDRCSNLTAICYNGSKAEWDAIANNAGYSEEVTIHYKGDTVEPKDPTCTDPGWKETGVCDVCGEHYSDKNDENNVIPALGHSWSEEYLVDIEPTCTVVGEKSKHCTREGCEARDDIQKIDALGHDYVETTVAPTCTEKGTLTKTCSRCNDVVTEEIPALGHEFAKDYTVDKKATCTEEGEQSKHCTRNGCNGKEDIQKIPSLGHDYVSKVTKEATCTEKGILTKTCSKCGDVVTEEIPALGHKFGDWKVTAEATVLAPEQQERICGTCGEKETKTVGTALKATATVNASTVKLKVKQSTSGLTVTGLANGDSVKSWKSTNTKIFTVSGKADGTCKLTAKKAGTAKLQITLDSGLKKTVTVKVQKAAVKTTKVTVANTKVTVQKGKKVTLKPVVTPFTSKQKVTYTTSNKKIAIVSKNGVVTGKKKGTAKITVKSGNKSVKVTVKVK